MKIVVGLLLLLLFPPLAQAAKPQAAFIRNGDLWLLQSGQEVQLTQKGSAQSPVWSHDGKLLAYQQEVPAAGSGTQSELWVYDLETKKQKRIFYDGYHAQWAPHDNRIAFQSGGVLNISDLQNFRNAALGVDDYMWLPDGKGFLLSTSANLHPDGWTHPILYKKQLGQNPGLSEGITSFFTIPKDLKKDGHTVLPIHAAFLRPSPSGKWYAFIVSPTASMAMDENMLCSLSADGKRFETVAVMAGETSMPQWAPTEDILAYIAGSGRIVFGFKDKQLGAKAYPAFASLTPAHYAELSFTWRNNASIITSRVKEAEWSNDFAKHPLPSLYSVDIRSGRQTAITQPPHGLGDYNPQYVKSMDKLIWFRSPSITDRGEMWIANPDGTGAKKWLKHIESITFFESKDS